MSESKHTPGEWCLGDITFADVPSHDGTRKGRLAATIYPAGNRFTMIRVGARTDDREEVLANAHIVIAGPDMLAALKTFVDEYVDMVASGDCGFWNAEEESKVIAARAAIAKAEGRA